MKQTGQRALKAALALLLLGQNFVCSVSALASASPASTAAGTGSDDSSQGLTQPITRISRPHSQPPPDSSGANSSPGAGKEPGKPSTGDIKLMPMQPTIDQGPQPLAKPQAPAQPQSQAPAPAPASTGMPPIAPPRPGTTNTTGGDPYPTIGRMEAVTLGQAQPAMAITDRLARLETAVFKKVYVGDSLFDRTDRLKNTLLGPDTLDPNSAAARDRDENPLLHPSSLGTGLGLGALDPSASQDVSGMSSYFDELASNPENQKEVPTNVLNAFALEMINFERRNSGLGPLLNDDTADKVAAAHVAELASRSILSHFSISGENPDRRYTLAGGNDAMVESIASIKTSELGNTRLTKAALARLVKALMSRQDDREALMSPDASHFGFALALSSDRSKVLSAFEVIARHGVVEKVPAEVAVGEKLEIKGTMEAPYVFDKITVAWEATNSGANASSADESEDALPYFPPLDYVAYAGHSDHDYHKTILALKTIGVVAAIAGGVFIPPVALAAPLIIMSGGPGSEPKPVSDIPVKGGVKVDGANFDAKIPISNANKEGLYYITIYGSLGSHSQQSVPLSRRVVVAKALARPEAGAEKFSSKDRDKDKGQAVAEPQTTKYDDEVSGKVETKNEAGQNSNASQSGTTGGSPGDNGASDAPPANPNVFSPEAGDSSLPAGKTNAVDASAKK